MDTAPAGRHAADHKGCYCWAPRIIERLRILIIILTGEGYFLKHDKRRTSIERNCDY